MRRARRLGCLAAVLAAGGLVTITTAPSAVAAPDHVIIAEFMAANATTLVDEDGAASDWIELWNPTASPVDLTGWHLTDAAGNPAKWPFPAVVLPADARLVVFASSKDRNVGELHTNFALSASGEYLALTDAGGAVVDAYAPSFPPQSVDVSYGLGSNDVIGRLEHPTPGAPNAAAGLARAATPAFDRAGGYVTGSVTVAITSATPGATIRYTLDASTPTLLGGIEYTVPFTVTGTTTIRAVAFADGLQASTPASLTLLDVDQVLDATGTPAGWPVGPVNGQLLQYGVDAEVVAAQRADVAASLQAAPTLSIVTDQVNLTDPDVGIYVNATESGAAWERPASIELFGTDDAFTIAGGVRIKGGYSRLDFNPKHSLRLSFTSAYDGALTGELFGDGVDTFASLDVRSEQNHSWHYGLPSETFLRELWTRDATAAIDGAALRSRWVHLFLNGQYWGVYTLAERWSGTQAAAMFGGSASDYDIIEHDSDTYQYEVGSGDDAAWRRLWALTSDQLVDDVELAEITTLVDLTSLARMQVLIAATGNIDATPSAFLGELVANNWTAVRGTDGRFRFFVSDAEHSLGAGDHAVGVDRTGPWPVGAANPSYDRAHFNPAWLHQALLSVPSYRQLVASVAEELLATDGVLGPAASADRWMGRAAQVQPLVQAEAARWGRTFDAGPYGVPDWEAEVAWVRDHWFPVRSAIALDQIADRLDPRLTTGATATAEARRLGPASP